MFRLRFCFIKLTFCRYVSLIVSQFTDVSKYVLTDTYPLSSNQSFANNAFVSAFYTLVNNTFVKTFTCFSVVYTLHM